MDTLLKTSLGLTAFATALIAGLFYAYSVSVNPGLAQLSDTEYLKAMKSINKAILNPWFFLSFMGTLIMMPAATGLYYKNVGIDASFYLLLSASLVYMIGVFGVTIFGNVPLNNALDGFDIGAATSSEVNSKRQNFEASWNRFHAVRTVANAIALVVLLFSIVRKL